MTIFLLYDIGDTLIGAFSRRDLAELVQAQYPDGRHFVIRESTLDVITNMPAGLFTYAVTFDLEGRRIRANQTDPRECTDEVVDAGDNGMFGTYCWASSAAEAIAIADERRIAFVEKRKCG